MCPHYKATMPHIQSMQYLVRYGHVRCIEHVSAVRRCELEPNGTFYVEAFDPSIDDKRHAELMAKIDSLSREVAALRPRTAGD